MLKVLVLVCTGLSASALGTGYLVGNAPLAALMVVLLGAAWLAGEWLDRRWVASASFAASSVAAAVGVWLGLSTGWMLLGLVTALSAWDLDHFRGQMAGLPQTEQTVALARRHAVRLLLVMGLGLALAAVAAGAQIRVGLALLLLLGLLLFLALNRAITFLRRQVE